MFDDVKQLMNVPINPELLISRGEAFQKEALHHSEKHFSNNGLHSASKPNNDPVYSFLDKKRSEGKHYYVYMMAGANKFLCINYTRVNEYLNRYRNNP